MRPVCWGLLCARLVPSTSLVGQTMSLAGAKSYNLIAMLILISAVLLSWSAEAGPPKHFGHKLRNASAFITTQKIKNTDGSVTCFAINSGHKNICAEFDAYPLIQFPMPANPVRGIYSRNIPGPGASAVAYSSPTQRVSVQCKLISAKYQPWLGPCP
jgi:hypothetical protein